MLNYDCEPHKSSILDLNANVIALIAYAAAIITIFIPGVNYISWLVPIIIYFMEKNSEFVKFHAMQGFLLNMVGIIINLVILFVIGGSVGMLFFTPLAYGALGTLLIVGLVTGAVNIAITIFEIIAMVKAYQYRGYKIPMVGRFAEKIVKKI
ncbi:MAG: DUF4870 domain-containing protein [Clostridium sp.]|uniref:DUF4870 domain-containing protein n=1 Tax=Clostridium sp. TaxID=1506 RepID=UPI00303226F9